MDALIYMSDMISDTGELISLEPWFNYRLRRHREFMKSTKFRDLSVDDQHAQIKSWRLTAQKVGKLASKFVGDASRGNDLVKELYREKIHGLIRDGAHYFEKVETEMDALLYMSDMISDTRELIDVPPLYNNYIRGLREFMKSTKFRDQQSCDDQQALINSVRLTAQKVGKLISEFVGHASRKQSSSSGNDLVKKYYRQKIQRLIIGMLDEAGYFTYDRELMEDSLNELDRRIQSNKVENVENMLLEEADISNCIKLNKNESYALFFKKAFPAFDNMQNDHERRISFLFEFLNELGFLPDWICGSWQEQPLALVLIGGLLSLKPMTNNIWKRVKDDLDKIKRPDDNNVTTDHMGHIFTYCYNDLPHFLQPCFLYFACYRGFEIPATSLTQIWIAEGFVEEEDKQTSLETTANKYLDELVQRSLVFVSKRSFLGTIKSCRLPRSIHEFAIQQSYMEGFSVVNPDQEEIESRFHVAIYQDNKKQFTEVKNNNICSILAFNFDGNVLESAMLLKVLALRNPTIPVTTLPNMIYLRYLGLRGRNISHLPQNIGDMKHLQTLDVRDTSIETLHESLWNIKTLRHVYLKPSPQPKGPPSDAHIDNLHTLKTVAAHESWVENIPHFLIHLRKLALSNWDDLDWKSISNLLSHMDKLISMAIMGKIIPSEFVDLRAFPNLKTVMSIKLVGEWNCRKFPIDDITFPPNLTKLTLTKSGLTEDPMPALGRLQALKFLSLQDEAYTGKKMFCSPYGFPQLQFLELSKLENLEIWVVGWKALLKLTTLRLVQCRKLNCLPYYLHFVTIIDIDD